MAETVICRYIVDRGRQDEFAALLASHWPALRRLELVTEAPSRVYRRIDGDERADTVEIVEIFEWVDADAAGVAHTHPGVSIIWERMGELADDMHFPHYEELTV